MIKNLIVGLNTSQVAPFYTKDDYSNLLDEIEQEGISSQIYYLLKKKRRLHLFPTFFQEKLEEEYNKTFYQNLYIKNQAKKILVTFERHKINTIPIKGTYFAERYFGHIGARGTSDIDLLVRKEEVELVFKCLRDLGFQQEEVIPKHFHVSYSKEIPGSLIPLTVEIHWNLIKESTSNIDINRFWDESVCLDEYRYIRQLSDYHTFYMICLHGWRHNLDSTKYYIDVIQLIHKLGDKINYQTLFNDAKLHKTFKRIAKALSAIYQEYPYLHEVNPLPELPFKKIPTFYNRREKGKHTLYKDFIDYQFLSYDSTIHIVEEIRSWVFPSRWDVLHELKVNRKGQSYLEDLINLYKQRISGILKSLLVKTQ